MKCYTQLAIIFCCILLCSGIESTEPEADGLDCIPGDLADLTDEELSKIEHDTQIAISKRLQMSQQSQDGPREEHQTGMCIE